MAHDCDVDGVPFSQDEPVARLASDGTITLIDKALEDPNIGVGNIEARMKDGRVYIKGQPKPVVPNTNYARMDKDRVVAIHAERVKAGRKLPLAGTDHGDYVSAIKIDDASKKK